MLILISSGMRSPMVVVPECYSTLLHALDMKFLVQVPEAICGVGTRQWMSVGTKQELCGTRQLPAGYLMEVGHQWDPCLIKFIIVQLDTYRNKIIILATKKS